MAIRSLLTISLTAHFLSTGTNADIFPRDANYPAQPPCTYPFTSFDYAGCYIDPSSPDRALAYDTQLDSSNMTVELCTASCKANGFIYAGLEYYGECFCGDTVSGPATTQDQCDYACTGNSSEICGGFDRVSIYMDPTFAPTNTATISDYVSMGCYTEGYNGRAVAFQQKQVDSTTLTTEICLQTCKDQSYPLAATEYSGQCFCGVVLGNGTAPAPSTDCNMACSGDPSETCGGSNRLNLYVAADLEEAAPCGPGVQPPASTTQTTSSSMPSTSTATGSTTSAMSITTSTTYSTSSTPSPSSSPTSSTTISSTSSALSSTSSASSSISSTTWSSTSSTTSTTPLTTSTTSSTPSTTSTTLSKTTSITSTSATPTTGSTTYSTTPTTTQVSSTTTKTSSTTSQTPSTSTTISTTLITSTKTSSASKCIATAPAPTCEYGVGSWCSKPLPPFSDSLSCEIAVAACVLQIADCWITSGQLACSQFTGWCSNINQYCGSCSGSQCSKSGCTSKYPPQNTPTSIAGVCIATTISTAPSATNSVIPPTATNVCVLPTGASNSGYSVGQCVGGIALPILTCNDQLGDWYSNPFKLYTSKYSSQCSSYPRSSVPLACANACHVQYESCIGVYANSCQGKTQWGSQDSYWSAKTKCENQLADCLLVNQKTKPSSSRCASWNSGWS